MPLGPRRQTTLARKPTLGSPPFPFDPAGNGFIDVENDLMADLAAETLSDCPVFRGFILRSSSKKIFFAELRNATQWLHSYRRLVVSYEYQAANFFRFVQLVCILSLWGHF